MPFQLIRSDITTVNADAIVNAANSALAPGGGVCGAIFAAAGYDKLERACRKLGGCETGQAVITKGFDLPAHYIIHTVGPVWHGGGHNEAGLLKSCYRNSLHLAEKNKCESIAFPLISAGIFGYPWEEALRIAVDTIREFLESHEMEVTLVLFDRNSMLIGEGLFGDIRSFIDDHYVDTHTFSRTAAESSRTMQHMADDAVWRAAPSQSRFESLQQLARPFSSSGGLADALSRLEEPFSAHLFRLIDKKGMTDVEVYKRANIDRKLFSKLRKKDYTPSKPTALALAVALRLNLEETNELLRHAGYALSHSSKSDVILEYFIQKERYDIFEINQALFTFDQKLLGA